MNTNAQATIKAEFGKMTNKELYAWLRTNYPDFRLYAGRTKQQLLNDIYVCRFDRDETMDKEKENKERDSMSENDSDAPDAETDEEEDDESVADDVSIPDGMFDDESRDDYDDKGILCHYSAKTGGWEEIDSDEDDTPVANMFDDEKDALIAKLQAQVAELQAQLQDAKDDMKDMVASLKGIITNQQYRDTVATLPAYEPKPAPKSIIKKTPTKPAPKAPVEQPEGKRYTYKRPLTYEGDYCKEGMVVEMSIKRLWVEGIAMRLAYDPSPEGNWIGLNARWRGRRFLNLQRASTECCELNQIANSPNAWAAFRCINPKNDEYISIERLDKHPNWADCKVLMMDDEGASGEDDEDN